MSKLTRKRLVVKINARGEPVSLLYGSRWFGVKRVHEVWKDTGCWWEGETEKLFFRLETSAHGLMEIYYDTGEGNWYLYKIYD